MRASSGNSRFLFRPMVSTKALSVTAVGSSLHPGRPHHLHHVLQHLAGGACNPEPSEGTQPNPRREEPPALDPLTDQAGTAENRRAESDPTETQRNGHQGSIEEIDLRWVRMSGREYHQKRDPLGKYE